jgi:hypothetical protein
MTRAGGSPGVTADPPGVPYFSRWESPELVGRFLDGSLRAADDPRRDGMLRFHNPSGRLGISQRDALAGQADFARFAAGRSIILPS